MNYSRFIGIKFQRRERRSTRIVRCCKPLLQHLRCAILDTLLVLHKTKVSYGAVRGKKRKKAADFLMSLWDFRFLVQLFTEGAGFQLVLPGVPSVPPVPQLLAGGTSASALLSLGCVSLLTCWLPGSCVGI